MPADGGTAPATAPHPGRTTQLMYACSQGDLHQVKRILLEQPETLTQLDRTYRTALHYCAGGSTLAVFPSSSTTKPAPRLSHCADVLLMEAPDLVHSRDQDGFTPLHLAVIAGNVQLVHFLLANGADVNGLDQEMHSVVHWATVCGETAALGAVLAAGAEISTPDVHGGYPLHYAAQMCGSEKPELGLQVLHILLNHPGISVPVTDNDGRQPLLWAASAGSARAVLALVRAGAAVEAADKDGLTALHCAASRGHTDTLDTLLTLCGAQTDVIDSNGCTALHYSVTLGHADATALLLSHSADPNLQDRKGRSPAHCGCAKGQLETVRQLHTAGANLWLRTARGDLPLHEAAASGRRQLVRWLLDQRPSQVNARNNDGRGLLHLAALNDNADMCKILLDSGAAVNPLLRTSKNVFMTPLDCALQRGFRSTAKFLQLHGGVPANRLNTLRLTSELASNLTAASHLHIREDITVFDSSSSGTEAEDPLKSKDHRARRKTVRRKLSYRHDRKRRSYSGSEQELKTRAKSSSRSAHEKAPKKHKSKRRAKSRDSAVRKEIEVRSDGKQFRKKDYEETDETVSESDVSDENERQKTAIKLKTTDIDREKQNSKHKNGYVSNLNSLKKTAPSETDQKNSKKSQEESNRDLSDTEKSKKVTSDKERRKSKKYSKEEESCDEDRKKKRKSPVSTGENSDTERKDNVEHSEIENSKKKSSDIESKCQKKCRKSDISDTDQKSKISDSDKNKKKSADKKRLRDKSIEEKPEGKEEQTVEKEKLSAKIKIRESQEEQITKEIVKRSESAITAKLEEEKLQKHEDKSEDKNKQEELKLKKESEKTKASTEETSIEATKDVSTTEQDTGGANHIEKDVEQATESLQADQVSLQSKLSEESPSKTIVVEAAVHHPPKGVNSEEVQEELQPVVEENKEAIEDNKEIVKESEEIVAETEETVVGTKDTVEETVEEKKDEPQDVKVEEEQTVKEESPEGKPEIKTEEEEKGTVLATENEEVDVVEQTKLTAQQSQDIELKNNQVTEDLSKSSVVDDSISKEEDKIKTNDVKEESQNDTNKTKEDKDIIMMEKEKDTIKEEKSEDKKTAQIDADSNQEKIIETPEQQTNEVTDQKQDKTKTKNELNIDLSLKKFEETAKLQNEATDVDENENLNEETTLQKQNGVTNDVKQKKYRKKVKLSKSISKSPKDSPPETKDILPTEVKKQEVEEQSSSTSRETSSSESESEKSPKKSKLTDSKNGEHKSFKVLREDVAFEVLNDPTVKESRRIRKHSKRRQKEAEKLNESATSSPEMLESARTRSKSVPRQKSINQTLTLPSLTEGKRPESNLSAPNLSSVYSDNEQKSGSNSEADDLICSASRKKRIKKRSKLRAGSKSAGSDYESSNLIDSGFEPSPRSSRIPKRKVMSERGVNMTTVTQQIQSNIRRYHMERKIFQHLLDLKRLQIRSGQSNEAMLVKRAIDAYHNSVAATVGAGRYLKKDYSYKSFEQFLYQSLRMLQKTPTADNLSGLPEAPDNPLLCTQSTHRCLHATHAYTGIPCAAYLPKMNHHTMPKIGFTPRSSSFLPQINSKGKSVTLELCHGNDKQVISLPADRLDHNKRYYVTFTVKGQDGQSPTHHTETTSHRHAKSV